MEMPKDIDWKKYNKEKKEAIEKPNNKQKLQMDELHLTIYELYQEKEALQEALEKVNLDIEIHLKEVDELLKSKNPPNWAWRWIFKKSNISWKSEFVKRLGQAEANKIVSEAKQNEYPKIGIQYIDPNPDLLPENPITIKRQQKPIKVRLKG
jgi:hypothetical protein